MKLISTSTDRTILGMFDIAFYFKPYKGNANIDNEQYLNEICEWVVNSFTNNFVIIEHVDTHVAGGWTNNQTGWERSGFKVDRSKHSSMATYELRCHDVDASAFMLRWL